MQNLLWASLSMGMSLVVFLYLALCIIKFYLKIRALKIEIGLHKAFYFVGFFSSILSSILLITCTYIILLIFIAVINPYFLFWIAQPGAALTLLNLSLIPVLYCQYRKYNQLKKEKNFLDRSQPNFPDPSLEGIHCSVQQNQDAAN